LGDFSFTWKKVGFKAIALGDAATSVLGLLISAIICGIIFFAWGSFSNTALQPTVFQIALDLYADPPPQSFITMDGLFTILIDLIFFLLGKMYLWPINLLLKRKLEPSHSGIIVIGLIGTGLIILSAILFSI